MGWLDDAKETRKKRWPYSVYITFTPLFVLLSNMSFSTADEYDSATLEEVTSFVTRT